MISFLAYIFIIISASVKVKKNIGILAIFFEHTNLNATIFTVKIMNYGINLKAIRTSELLTQQEIANALNVSRSTYKEYETQNSIIPSKYLYPLSDIFNVSIDYILGLTTLKQYKNINKNIKNEIIKQRLKEFRKEHKLTQEKLAKELNTTQSVIADYERGRYLIATPFLYTICKKYHISADYLLGRIDEPKYFN